MATNIGFDGHWINQYGSVFFVLNEVGQVPTWEFTTTTSLNEAYPILDALALRLRNHNNRVSLVLVDNCCQVSNSIFGEQVHVRLDLFHAIQRLGRELSRFHPAA